MYRWESCRHCFYYCKGNFTILICQHSDSGVKLKFKGKTEPFPPLFTNVSDFYPGLRSPAFRVSSGHIQETGLLERFRERQDLTQESSTVQTDNARCFSLRLWWLLEVPTVGARTFRDGLTRHLKTVHQLKFWFS